MCRAVTSRKMAPGTSTANSVSAFAVPLVLKEDSPFSAPVRKATLRPRLFQRKKGDQHDILAKKRTDFKRLTGSPFRVER